MKRLAAGLAAAALALGSGLACAERTIEAGRLKLALHEDAWQAGNETPYTGEISSAMGTLQGKGRVLTLSSPDGAPLAVLYVGSTYGQPNVYSRKADCSPDARVYVLDLGKGQREDYRCAYFGGPFKTQGLIENGLPRLKAANATAALDVPDGAYFLFVHVTKHGGVNVHIEGLLAPGFAGLADGRPRGVMPDGLPPDTAAWVDALADAAVNALTSFSGALPVPPIEFSNVPK